ncbi:MAG TPA: FAD-binding oxidoreductase [Bryobacteraceae bacterium]|nr:FAD-binding oxidoreductase [Bryobacteraceae bacterium]
MASTHRLESRALLLLFAAAGILQAAGGFVEAEVVRIESLTRDVKRIRVKFPAAYTFQAGQFALFRVPGKFVEEWNAKYGTRHSEVRRPYSFASSPARLPYADFIIKLVPAPPGKDVPPGICSTWVHRYLKIGDRVEVGKPMGSMAISMDSTRAIVLVAGGAGVAPFVGLLEYWFETGVNQRRTIYLFLGVRQRQNLILHEQLTAWARGKHNFRYIPALSNPVPEDQWAGETGFLHSVLDRHFPGTLDADALLAGSPAMMQETERLLKSKGIPPEQIHHDPIQVQVP